MTKKDFELIARVLKRYPCHTRNAIAFELLLELEAINEKFDKDGFLIASGVIDQ